MSKNVFNQPSHLTAGLNGQVFLIGIAFLQNFEGLLLHYLLVSIVVLEKYKAFQFLSCFPLETEFSLCPRNVMKFMHFDVDLLITILDAFNLKNQTVNSRIVSFSLFSFS